MILRRSAKGGWEFFCFPLTLYDPHDFVFQIRSRSWLRAGFYLDGWQRGHNARYPALQESFFFHVYRGGCIAQVVDRLRLNRTLGGSPGVAGEESLV